MVLSENAGRQPVTQADTGRTPFEKLWFETMETDQNREDSWRERALDTVVLVLLALWVVLLIPWLPFGALAGMAFDSGNGLAAALFAFSAWSYGPAVFAAFKLLDRSRKAVLLPFFSFAGLFLGNFLSTR
jgi:hypothetical protein